MEQGLTWQALEWADGTRYEGLTRNGRMHSHGVLTFPNKDRYEGQFEEGRMHGTGAYVWSNGMVYRGDWTHGSMHGCGTAIWKQQGGELSAAEGKFFLNEFVGDVMPCGKQEGYDSAVEADVAAYQARSFLQWRGVSKSSLQGKAQGQLQHQQQRQQQPAASRQWASGQAGSSDVTPAGAAPTGVVLDEQQQKKLEGLVQRLALQPRHRAA